MAGVLDSFESVMLLAVAVAAVLLLLSDMGVYKLKKDGFTAFSRWSDAELNDPRAFRTR
jgi:hypothetical protein